MCNKLKIISPYRWCVACCCPGSLLPSCAWIWRQRARLRECVSASDVRERFPECVSEYEYLSVHCVCTSLPLCASCSNHARVLRHPLSPVAIHPGWTERSGRRTSCKKRQRDGVAWMKDRANVWWTVQDWERQRRELANQSWGLAPSPLIFTS